MRALTKLSLVLLLLSSGLSLGQFGQQGRFGRQGRSAIPQAQTPPKEPEAKTADQIVDEQMPNISENLELDPF